MYAPSHNIAWEIMCTVFGTQWPVIFSLYRHYAVSIPTLSMKLSGQCTRHSECSDSILRGPRNEIETIFSKMLIMVGL